MHGIPQTYLLDRDLKIVARDLHGAGLEKRLRDLLGPGDEAAAAAVDKAIREAAEKAADEASGADKKPPASAEADALAAPWTRIKAQDDPGVVQRLSRRRRGV